MKKISWEKQREYNLNLEYLYSLRDRQLEISDSEKLEKIEFRLYTDIFEYNGVEYVTYSKEIGVFDTIEEAINKYIELKLSEKIGKKDNSFVRKIAWTSFDGEVFGRVQFTVNMFNANYGEEYITLKEWAEIQGISDITARAKARKGLLESAKKYGRQWFIKASEKNLDNRLKENN